MAEHEVERSPQGSRDGVQDILGDRPVVGGARADVEVTPMWVKDENGAKLYDAHEDYLRALEQRRERRGTGLFSWLLLLVAVMVCVRSRPAR
jgi:hypothetical protein